MPPARGKAFDQEIMLGVLGAVDRGHVTQRRLSSELGIAVGLVNTCIKRCVNKGLIKVQQIPPHRYIYYLTAKGFLEKSRLIAEYFVSSFDFFRRAKASCEETLSAMAAAGHKQVAMAGASDLAEIAAIVATDLDMEMVAIVDRQATRSKLLGIPVRPDIRSVAKNIDAVMITSLSAPQKTYETAVAELGAARVYLPSVLADIAVRTTNIRPNGSRRGRK
jgi:predicted transcriptional regulator